MGIAREQQETAGGVKKRRLLIVEDEADTRWALAALLEFDGHEIDLAVDGKAGLDAVLNGRYEIALVDLALPRLSGYELARRVRDTGKPIILIALTGHGLYRDEEAAMEAGFDAFVLKPVSPQALMALVSDPPSRTH